MSSIKYEILSKCPGFKEGAPGPSKNTIEQYKTHAIRYGKWAKKKYGCRRFEELKDHIQDYADYLCEKGRRPATIHTYIAACCYVWDIPMEQIHKPERHCYDAVRSRGEKPVDQRADAGREASPRLYDFAMCVGIRRHEYQALRCRTFVEDESGYPCVEVRKGKGGKYQLQRILPDDVEFVKAYFSAGAEDLFVVTKREMKNKLDLHAIRATVAKRAYRYYSDKLRSDPDYRAQLTKEIELRWKIYRGTPPPNSKKKYDWEWDERRVRGEYKVRGKNRIKAGKNGLPVVYDRLAVMAVSVFHLSHWRCDVTVDNYLLADGSADCSAPRP